MKTLLTTLIAICSFTLTCCAQWTTAGAVMYNTNTGNVGIGTTNPTTHLAVSSGLTAPTTPDLNNSVTIGAGAANNLYKYLGQIGFVSSDPDFTAPKMVAYISGEATETYSNDAATGSLLRFYTGTNAGTSAVERMVINNLGRVGINTSTPSAQLEVAGATVVSGVRPITINPANGSILAKGNSGGWAQLFGFLGSGGTALGGFGGYGTADGLNRYYIGTYNTDEKVSILPSGNVGIGTKDPDQALTVNGQVHSTSVVVTSTVPADYVFDERYYLRPLDDVKIYVDKNHHLPDVPAAADFKKDGQNLGEMNMLLLRKVEELTLYMIEKDKQVQQQNEKIQGQQSELNQLKKQVKQLLNAKKRSL